MDADTRALFALATVASAIVLVVPRHLQGRALTALSCASALYWLYPSVWRRSDDATQQQQAESPEKPRGRRTARNGVVASVDPDLYTLRVSSVKDSRSGVVGNTRNLALRIRGRLEAEVRKAARLGSRNGNAASGVKAMSALEDFFSRYHRAVLSNDAEFAARTLDVLRDTRAVALNALNDISMTVPSPIGGRVLKAIDLARDETLRCMSTLVARHAASGSPTMAAAAGRWNSPTPHDPGAIIGRPDSLF